MAIQKVSDLPILRQSNQDFDYNKVKPSLVEISYKISSDDAEGVSRYQSMAVTVAELANYILSAQTAGDVVDLTLSGNVFLNNSTGDNVARTYRVLAKTGDVDIFALDYYKLFSPDIQLSCNSFTVKSAGQTAFTAQNRDITVAATTNFTQPVFVPTITDSASDKSAVNLEYLRHVMPNIESPFVLFETRYLDYAISSTHWVNTTTAGWLSSSTYPDAYSHLRNDWNNGTAVEIAYAKSNNTKITARRAPDGHIVCSSDMNSKVDSLFDAVGVAWMYVIDGGENGRFRLPRNSQFIKGCKTLEDVEEYRAPALPNHWHSFTYNLVSKCECADPGGIKNSHSSSSTASQSTAATQYPNSISVENTVRPPSMQMYLYMYCS